MTAARARATLEADTTSTEAPMQHVLVLYASNHGHTAKIAARVAHTIEEAGAVADLRALALAAELSPHDYDAVVIGASIHAAHHQAGLVKWIRAHAAALSGTPSAFFSVSMTAADGTAESAAAARRYIDELAEDTGWAPLRTASFAGALQYREYGRGTRLFVKMLMGREGKPTDTSRDYDFTDWEDVDRFAVRCAALPPAPVAA